MAVPELGPVADGDTFKVILFQSLYNQRIMNVLHYVCAVPGVVPPDRWAVCESLASALTDPVSLLTDLRVVQSQDLEHTSCRVQFQKEIDSTYPFFELFYSKPGSFVGTAGTANMMASVEKRAEFDPGHPRQGIGRVAIAGVPQEGILAGLLKDDYKGTFNAFVEDLTDDVTVLTDTVLAPCLSHKGATSWIDNRIFGASVKPEVRDMTRRTVGRGE